MVPSLSTLKVSCCLQEQVHMLVFKYMMSRFLIHLGSLEHWLVAN